MEGNLLEGWNFFVLFKCWKKIASEFYFQRLASSERVITMKPVCRKALRTRKRRRHKRQIPGKKHKSSIRTRRRFGRGRVDMRPFGLLRRHQQNQLSGTCNRKKIYLIQNISRLFIRKFFSSSRHFVITTSLSFSLSLPTSNKFCFSFGQN